MSKIEDNISTIVMLDLYGWQYKKVRLELRIKNLLNRFAEMFCIRIFRETRMKILLRIHLTKLKRI